MCRLVGPPELEVGAIVTWEGPAGPSVSGGGDTGGAMVKDGSCRFYLRLRLAASRSSSLRRLPLKRKLMGVPVKGRLSRSLRSRYRL